MKVWISLIFVASTATVFAQTGARNGEWRTYGGDLGHTRYAPLDQIDASNFSSLEVAWRFNTINMGPEPEYRFQSTPLVVGASALSTRADVAFSAAAKEATKHPRRRATTRRGARPAEKPSNQVQRILYERCGLGNFLNIFLDLM